MAADSRGRDTSKAPVYITGFAAIAPVDAANVVPKADLGSKDLGGTDKPIPAAFKFLGLRTSDGGPEPSNEAGDTIEFLEDGFEISGDGSISVQMTLAQLTPTVRELVRGSAPDANGVIEVSSTTPNAQHILLLEGVYKGGLMKRETGVVRITEVAFGKQERSTVEGITVTFKWLRHELFNRAYFWEAVVYDEVESP